MTESEKKILFSNEEIKKTIQLNGRGRLFLRKITYRVKSHFEFFSI